MKHENVINKKIKKDIEILAEFISIYCADRHGGADRARVVADGVAGTYIEPCAVTLCHECRKLLLHAVSKRLICPYDPKPSCKKCKTHCYAPAHRDRIREIMKFSGMRLIRQGRLGLIKKYFS